MQLSKTLFVCLLAATATALPSENRQLSLGFGGLGGAFGLGGGAAAGGSAAAGGGAAGGAGAGAGGALGAAVGAAANSVVGGIIGAGASFINGINGAITAITDYICATSGNAAADMNSNLEIAAALSGDGAAAYQALKDLLAERKEAVAAALQAATAVNGTSNVQQLTDFLGNLTASLKATGDAAGANLTQIIKDDVAFKKDLINKLVNATKTNFATAGAQIAATVNNASAALQTQLNNTIGSASSALKNQLTTLLNALKSGKAEISSAITKTVADLQGQAATGTEFLTKLAANLGGALGQAVSAFAEFTAALKAAGATISAGVQQGLAALGALAGGLGGAAGTAAGAGAGAGAGGAVGGAAGAGGAVGGAAGAGGALGGGAAIGPIGFAI